MKSSKLPFSLLEEVGSLVSLSRKTLRWIVLSDWVELTTADAIDLLSDESKAVLLSGVSFQVRFFVKFDSYGARERIKLFVRVTFTECDSTPSTLVAFSTNVYDEVFSGST